MSEKTIISKSKEMKDQMIVCSNVEDIIIHNHFEDIKQIKLEIEQIKKDLLDLKAKNKLVNNIL